MRPHCGKCARFGVLALAWMAGVAWAQGAVVTADGSSTVFPATQAMAEEFKRSTRDEISVAVGISGTRGGFRKFCAGETDISNASRPILKDEMEACRQAGVEYFELPVAFDALTIAVSPKNAEVDCLTIEQLRTIWEPDAQGTIVSWADVNAEWADRPLTLYGAGSDSGTFDYFTEAIVGTARASRSDYVASEDDNVLVRGVENDVNALGYVPYAYYAPEQARLKALGIDEGKGKGCVKPSLPNVLNGSYALSRPLFIYVSKKAARRGEVRRFVEYYLTKAPALMEPLSYLPLTDEAYRAAFERFRKGEVGTGFAGAPDVDLPIEELLKRRPVS